MAKHVMAERKRASAVLSTVYTDTAYEAATSRIDTHITPESQHFLRSHLGASSGDRFIAVMLTAEDLAVCEDFGRQLRELRRATTTPIVVLPDSTSVDVVSSYLARERLTSVAILPVSHSRLFISGAEVTTPAAFFVDMRTREADGVSHVIRFKFTRVKSFRDELGLGPELAKEGEGARLNALDERRSPGTKTGDELRWQR
jgi:hypothetical protein